MRLVTFPHTGTVFTRYVLGLMGLRDIRETGGAGEYMSHHTYELPLNFGDEKIVVPLRDPMLAEMSRINRGWGSPVEEWERILDLTGNVHFFRVQDGSQPDVDALASFLERDPPAVDWTPQNVRTDFREFKPRYYRGDVAPELRKAWNWLTESEDMKGLFHLNGYEFAWM